MNSRETPYFGEVSARTRQVEDREASARNALAKINQERTRRGEDMDPLPWAPFYAEWKKTHAIDGMTDLSRYPGELQSAMLEYR